MAMQNIDC